jgi:hypothetical protein
MKIFSFLIIILLFPILLFSQSFSPDRPGFSNGAYSVGLHRTDYESGWGYNGFGCYPINQLCNTNLFRFGMYKHLEFRFGTDFGDLLTNSQIAGIKALYFGVKIPIIQDIKYLPDIAILGMLNLPNIGKPEFSIPDHSPQGSLILQKGFGKFTVLGNVGILYDGINPYSQGFYCINLGYSITSKFGSFIESYSFFSSKTSPFIYGDLGFNYFITDDFQFDLSYGSGMSTVFINCGFSWRIPHKE